MHLTISLRPLLITHPTQINPKLPAIEFLFSLAPDFIIFIIFLLVPISTAILSCQAVKCYGVSLLANRVLPGAELSVTAVILQAQLYIVLALPSWKSKMIGRQPSYGKTRSTLTANLASFAAQWWEMKDVPVREWDCASYCWGFLSTQQTVCEESLFFSPPKLHTAISIHQYNLWSCHGVQWL